MDVWLVPRLGSIEGAGFEKNTFFFFADESVTHSQLSVSLMGCEKSEYRCLKVDANVIGGAYYHARLLRR